MPGRAEERAGDQGHTDLNGQPTGQKGADDSELRHGCGPFWTASCDPNAHPHGYTDSTFNQVTVEPRWLKYG